MIKHYPDSYQNIIKKHARKEGREDAIGSELIEFLFMWTNTYQGHDFWNDAYLTADRVIDDEGLSWNEDMKEEMARQLPAIPVFDESNFKRMYIGRGEVKENVIEKDTCWWEGNLYVWEPTSGPYNFFVTPVDAGNRFQYLHRYWSGCVHHLNIIKRV